MKKRHKDSIKSVLLSFFAYLRVLVVMFSVVAYIEKEWVALVLSWAVFGATTYAISWTFTSPDKEDIQNLTEILGVMTNMDKTATSEKIVNDQLDKIKEEL